MANWKNKIDLSDIFNQEEDPEPPDAARKVADRLKAIDFGNESDNDERDGLVEEFEMIADEEVDEGFLEDRFNNTLEDLYNFGDYGHRLWVNT